MQERNKREIGACGIAREREAAGVDAAAELALAHEADRGADILKRSGEGVLGRQPVFDPKHGATGKMRKMAHDAVMAFERAEGPAAAMQKDRHRPLLFTGRMEEARADDTGRSRHRDIRNARDREPRLIPRRRQTFKDPAPLRHRYRTVVDQRSGAHPFEDGSHMRVGLGCHAQGVPGGVSVRLSP